jgi:sugar lactone lactonase YvrE
MSVDQEGNFYVAEVGGGRVQKFSPRQGARTETLIAKPPYVAWD